MWAMPRRQAKERHGQSPEGCRLEHQELSSGQARRIAPSGRAGLSAWHLLCCPPAFFLWDGTVTHSTPPETLTTLHMAAKALHPARPCIPTAPPPLGPPSTDTPDLGSGLSEPRLPRPPPAPQMELFESQGALACPCIPTASAVPGTDEVLPTERLAHPPDPLPTLPCAQGRQTCKKRPAAVLSVAHSPPPRKVQEAMGGPSSSLGTSGERAWYILAGITGPCSQSPRVVGLTSPSPEVRVLLTHHHQIAAMTITRTQQQMPLITQTLAPVSTCEAGVFTPTLQKRRLRVRESTRGGQEAVK